MNNDVNDEILKGVIKYFEMENEKIAYQVYIEPLIAMYGSEEVEKYMKAVFLNVLAKRLLFNGK